MFLVLMEIDGNDNLSFEKIKKIINTTKFAHSKHNKHLMLVKMRSQSCTVNLETYALLLR